MNINFTLVAQAATFAIFIWFTVRFVWPPLMRVVEERQQRIADGLAAGERGRQELEVAQKKALDEVRHARESNAEMRTAAEKKAAQHVDRRPRRGRCRAHFASRDQRQGARGIAVHAKAGTALNIMNGRTERSSRETLP